MALFDLAQYDIMDLILASDWEDEVQVKVMEAYLEGYSNELSEILGKELNDTDQEELQALMKDESITSEKLMKAYTDKIPQMEAKILTITFAYKKDFILGVYKNKLEEYKTSSNKDGLAAWEQIYKDAEEDNWNEVYRLLQVLKSLHTPLPTTSIN